MTGKVLAAGVIAALLAWCSTAYAVDDQTVAKCVYNASPPTVVDGATVALQCDVNGTLQTTGSGGGGGGDAVAQGANTSGQSGTLVQGAVTTSAPSYTTAKTNPVSLTTAGDLRAVISNTAFTANAGTNLNTSALALDATVGTTNTDLGPPGATACATDNGSCSLNALLQRNNQRLTTINTTLGTPFQAGGSIGNTTFAATQSGAWNITNISGTVSLPTGAATAAKQPALGTAGTASSDVISVQGIASMTPLKADPGTAANWAVGATASAPPANAHYTGVSSSGNMVGLVGCDSHVFKHITSATDTLAVQGVSAKTIKICGVLASFSGSAAQSIFLENTASTNANCSSSNTQIMGLLTGNATSPLPTGFYNSIWGGLANTSANGLCINSSGTGGVDVDIWYTQGS